MEANDLLWEGQMTNVMKPTHPLQGILLAIALNTIGLAAHSQSNVYSINIVGYVNQIYDANRYYLAANPLHTTNDLMQEVIPFPPEGARVWLWDVSNQAFNPPSVFSASNPGWSANLYLPVGRGFMLHSPIKFTNTYVGVVVMRSSNSVAGAYKLSLLGSSFPASGGLSSGLQFPASEGDTVSEYDAQAQQYEAARIYYSGYGWYSDEPVINVAQGFFVRHPGLTTNWLQNFTIPRPADPSPPPAPEPAPEIESFTVRNGVVTLKINKATKLYNVQFSTDRVNWTNIAVNQTAKTWKGPLPPGPAGFFQVVQP